MAMPGAANGRPRLLRLRLLVVLVTLAAVCLALFLGRRAHVETKRFAFAQFNEQQLILAHTAARAVETYFVDLKTELVSIANVPEVEQMTPECLLYMQHLGEGFPIRTSVRRLDRDGVLRFIYPFAGWRGELVGRNYGDEDCFQDAKKSGQNVFSGMVVNEQGERRFRLVVPVYRRHEKKTVNVGGMTGIIISPVRGEGAESELFAGALIGSLDPGMIDENIIAPIIFGKTGHAWLLDDAGIFLAHFEKDLVGQNAFTVRAEKGDGISSEAIERIQQRMLAGEKGVGRYISGWRRQEDEPIEKLVAFAPVRVNGGIWSVAVCAPVSEAEETVRMVRRSEFLTRSFVIIALISCGAVLLVISRRWSRLLEREVTRQTRKLKETSEYLQNLFRYANAPMIAWDSDKRVTVFNRAFEHMSGRTEGEMIGQPLDVLFSEDSRADCIEKIVRASEAERWETVEIPILHKNGEVRLGLWNSANVYGEDGRTIIATIAQGHDITDRKRVEAEKVKLEEYLRQSQKLEAIGQLAGGVAHDFNNMLMAIMGYSDLLLGRTGLECSVCDEIEEIHKAGKRAATLTRQLLAFGRKQALMPEVVDFNAVVTDMCDMLRRLIGEDMEILTVLEEKLERVMVDPGQLQQVIINLVVNARDAMAQGGNITIRTANVVCDVTDTSEGGDIEPGHYVMLSISDTGVGMDDEIRSHIFEPFFTTKGRAKGTGMGLATVYGIVKQSGGHIRVHSRLGNGTTVEVYLPHTEKAAKLEIRSQSAARSVQGAETILLVEDEASVRGFARNALEEYGYTVLEAGNGDEALAIYKQHKEPIHLLLSDVVMPGMNGLQLAEQISAVCPGTKVLLMSGYAHDSHSTDASGSGWAFLQKPFTANTLARKVREVLAASGKGT